MLLSLRYNESCLFVGVGCWCPCRVEFCCRRAARASGFGCWRRCRVPLQNATVRVVVLEGACACYQGAGASAAGWCVVAGCCCQSAVCIGALRVGACCCRRASCALELGCWCRCRVSLKGTAVGVLVPLWCLCAGMVPLKGATARSAAAERNLKITF